MHFWKFAACLVGFVGGQLFPLYLWSPVPRWQKKRVATTDWSLRHADRQLIGRQTFQDYWFAAAFILSQMASCKGSRFWVRRVAIAQQQP